MDQTCTAPDCDKPVRTRGLCKTHYNRTLPSYGAPPRDLAKRRAGWRAKNHKRRGSVRMGDVTADDEQAMRTAAKRCPLCKVKLIAEPYRPASKELDHIVPRCMGGTHTHGNVRVICRACNLSRPKDGSDYSGPVTLWAQDPTVAARRRAISAPKIGIRVPPRCACGEPLSRGRCWTCRPKAQPRTRPAYIPASQLTGEQRRERTRRAVQMRAEGSTWWDIADALGFGRESSAFQAVREVAERS